MSSEWEDFEIEEGFDAYVDWIRDPGKHFPPEFGQSNDLPKPLQVRRNIMVRLNSGATLDLFRIAYAEAEQLFSSKAIAKEFSTKEEDTKPIFRLSRLYALGDSRTAERRHFVAQVNDLFFHVLNLQKPLKALKGKPLHSLVSRVALAQQLAEDAFCDQEREPNVAKKNDSKLPPKGICVVGVIDEGLAFAHERFRRSALETRVEHVWMQDARWNPNDTDSIVDYGRELSKDQIDGLLQNHQHAGLINEDAVYREAGLVDFSRAGHKAAAWRVAHGTHVMDLACGYDMGESPQSEYPKDSDRKNGVQVLDDRPIICVQLPTVTIADTSGLGLEKYMLAGVDYILARADKIALDRGLAYVPVVINFSSGVRAGPHDGTHPIETALDEVILERRARGWPTEVVLPSGNSHLARGHAQVRLEEAENGKNGAATEKPKSAHALNWRVLPDDRTFSYLEIWLPNSVSGKAGGSIELTVTPPNQDQGGVIDDSKSRSGIAWKPNGQDTLCKVYYEYVADPTERGRFVVAILPTAYPDIPLSQSNRPKALAPSGNWRIGLKNKSDGLVRDIHAWIHWDDSPIGYRRRGRQSNFVDACYRRFDEISGRLLEEDQPRSAVKRSGNINAIATGVETIVAGGFVGKELCAARYSAGGPVSPKGRNRRGHREGPDAMAVVEDSAVLLGVLAAGTRSGSTVAMNGTSVASPQITRRVAYALARGEDGLAAVLDIAAEHEAFFTTVEGRRRNRREPIPPERKGRGRAWLSTGKSSQACRLPY